MNEHTLPIFHCPRQVGSRPTLAGRSAAIGRTLTTQRPPTLAIARPESFSRALTAWESIARQLRNPDLELDAETFAGIWTAWQAAKRAGVTTCPVLAALLGLLQRQVLLIDAEAEGGAE